MEQEASPALTTLVVIIGASEWPDYKELNGGDPGTFARSARDFKEYFLNQFGLPTDNLKDLFDTSLSPSDIDREIGKFIDDRIHALESSDGPACNLLIYFVGHGGFDDHNDYYLAIRCTREDNPGASGLRPAILKVTLKKKARSLRHIIILDCCFAGAALKDLQTTGLEDAVTQQTRDLLIDTKKGSSLLSSSSNKDISISVSHDKRHTAFTGALLYALKGNEYFQQDYLSLEDVTRAIREYLHKHYDNADGRTPPMPRIDHPDQSEENIAEFQFFPNIAKRQLESVQGAFRKFTEIDDGKTQCCVILSEVGEKVEKAEKGESLRAIVRRMLRHCARDIEGRIKNRLLNKEPYVIHISKVFASQEMFDNALAALCHSSIAVFDVTNFEPAVMLLLGIRSVVRRGVTILSTRIDPDNEALFEAPFNIKETNVISHSEGSSGKDPMMLIGERVKKGLEQLSLLPHYLDLPSFDAIRTLPLDPDGQIPKPKDYTEQVLILCPFGKEYRENNWQRHIKRYLGLEIQDSANLQGEPDLIRTLDMKSPRIVSQTLYETIRLTDMCVVDWTGWRPNVFFELGVRLAANKTGPVCIIEDHYNDFILDTTGQQTHNKSTGRPKQIHQDDRSRLEAAASQCLQLLALFKPIIYKASEGDADLMAYKRMISYYQKVLKYVNNQDEEKRVKLWEDQGKTLVPDYTYKALCELIDIHIEIATKPVYNELRDSANLLDGIDRTISPVLYHQNSELRKKAQEGADERRLAAWYYLNGRYDWEVLANDNDLADIYIKLGNDLSDALFQYLDSDSQKRATTIRKQVNAFKVLRKEKSNGNANT